jgi:hypothetical protein
VDADRAKVPEGVHAGQLSCARPLRWRLDVGVFVRVRCAGCAEIVYFCESDYRGQIYCSEGCQGDAVRESKARHQRSREGRLDHAARNADYRARRKIVTDTRCR